MVDTQVDRWVCRDGCRVFLGLGFRIWIQDLGLGFSPVEAKSPKVLHASRHAIPKPETLNPVFQSTQTMRNFSINLRASGSVRRPRERKW